MSCQVTLANSIRASLAMKANGEQTEVSVISEDSCERAAASRPVDYQPECPSQPGAAHRNGLDRSTDRRRGLPDQMWEQASEYTGEMFRGDTSEMAPRGLDRVVACRRSFRESPTGSWEPRALGRTGQSELDRLDGHRREQRSVARDERSAASAASQGDWEDTRREERRESERDVWRQDGRDSRGRDRDHTRRSGERHADRALKRDSGRRRDCGGTTYSSVGVAVNKQLTLAKNVGDVLFVFESSEDSLSDVNIATAVHRLGKLGCPHPGTISTAEQKLIMDDPRTHKLMSKATQCAGRFKPQEAANVVWGLAKMKMVHTKLLGALVGGLNLAEFKAQDISTMLISMARLSYTLGSELLVECTDVISKLLKLDQRQRLKSDEIANVLWGFAVLVSKLPAPRIRIENSWLQACLEVCSLPVCIRTPHTLRTCCTDTVVQQLRIICLL